HAKNRRMLLTLPFDPSTIILDTGAPTQTIKDYLTRPYRIGLNTVPSPIPNNPPILIPIVKYIEPGDLQEVIYMYVGPHGHRVMYIYQMQEQGSTSPITISSGGFAGEMQAIVSWAQPIADLIVEDATNDPEVNRQNLIERVSILEEVAKVVLRQHGG